MEKLLVLLIGLSGCCNAGSEPHTKSITGVDYGVNTVCVNGIEYVYFTIGYKGGITISLDKDGKPKQCNY